MGRQVTNVKDDPAFGEAGDARPDEGPGEGGPASDLYQREYVQSFIEKWDELINWDGRTESESGFFIDLLRSRGKTRILDAAAGTGFHSIQLRNAGFDVLSADGSPDMLKKAQENAEALGLSLDLIEADWRWLNRDVHEKFDAIVCLGNSFTHLFEEADRRKALAEFYAALKHDGMLIIDQRNYDALLKGDYGNKRKYYYCGDRATAAPEFVSEGLVKFRYEFADGAVYHLNFFPLRAAYMRRLLKEVAFEKVTTFGDFQHTYGEDEPDFLIHVAEKREPEAAGDDG